MLGARRRSTVAAIIVVAGITLAAACTQGGGGGSSVSGSAPSAARYSAAPSSTVAPSAEEPDANAKGIEKLNHLIFIVQENRSFDQYFGTFPGADGIPTNPDGTFSVCVPDKFQAGRCMAPYVTRSIDQDGGPHNHEASVRDVD